MTTLTSSIFANSGAHTIIDDKIIKLSFNKNNVATIKNKWNSNKDLITRACSTDALLPIYVCGLTPFVLSAINLETYLSEQYNNLMLYSCFKIFLPSSFISVSESILFHLQ